MVLVACRQDHAGDQADADLLSAGIDEANLGLNDQIADPLRIHLPRSVVVDPGTSHVHGRAFAREHDNRQLQADLQAQMVSLDETDGRLQGGGDQIGDRHGRLDWVAGRIDDAVGSEPLELQRRPRDGGDQPEGDVERRQDLGAVQGEIALRVGRWPEQLEIYRSSLEPRCGLRLCLAWRGEAEQGRRECETEHVLAKIHAFLRMVRSGWVLRPTQRAFAGHRPLYISARISGKESRFNLGRYSGRPEPFGPGCNHDHAHDVHSGPLGQIFVTRSAKESAWLRRQIGGRPHPARRRSGEDPSKLADYPRANAPPQRPQEEPQVKSDPNLRVLHLQSGL